MEGVPSDVVELIIAVDLNPSDPAEPINVSSVDVRDKGEDGEHSGESCHMCTRILEAISKIDPEMESAVDGKPVEEAVAALERMAGEAPEEARDEADMFDKAMGSKPMGGMGSMMMGGHKRDDEDEE